MPAAGVVVEFRGEGTQTGPSASPAGAIPPTGKRIGLDFAKVLTFRGGKIVEIEQYFNLADLLRQLDLMPSSAPASS